MQDLHFEKCKVKQLCLLRRLCDTPKEGLVKQLDFFKSHQTEASTKNKYNDKFTSLDEDILELDYQYTCFKPLCSWKALKLQ